MRRGTVTPGVSRCGWCSTGHHKPTDTSRGCTRYRPGSTTHPCHCDHPAHEEPT